MGGTRTRVLPHKSDWHILSSCELARIVRVSSTLLYYGGSQWMATVSELCFPLYPSHLSFRHRVRFLWAVTRIWWDAGASNPVPIG